MNPVKLVISLFNPVMAISLFVRVDDAAFRGAKPELLTPTAFLLAYPTIEP